VVYLALITTACGRSPRVTFYLLEPVAKKETSALAKGAVPTIVVGPVTLPEVVDRPQLVVGVAANRVDILEEHRWAEPLNSEIPSLIAQNLGRMLGSNRVWSYRQQVGVVPDYHVLLDFVRFESQSMREVIVEAFWTIRSTVGGVTRVGHSLVHENAQEVGYDSLVDAYNRALVDLSGDLARTIQAEAAQAPAK
jgi:uncharacterized lipoprotein YmbA